MPMGIDPLHDVSEGNIATISKFCKEIRLDGVSDKTISNYRSMLAIMGRHLKATPYSEATKEQIQQFFLNTKMKPALLVTRKSLTILQLHPNIARFSHVVFSLVFR